MVLRLVALQDVEGEAPLDILVKTDMAGTTQSERFCVPERLVQPTIQDLHLRLTHFGTEIVTLNLKQLVWFPGMWNKVRQVLMCCQGCIQKSNHQLDKQVARCYYPREKGCVAEIVHLDLAGPLPTKEDGYKYILGIQLNFSGYCVAVPINNKEHETVATGFLDPQQSWSRTMSLPAEFLHNSANPSKSNIAKLCSTTPGAMLRLRGRLGP